MSKAKLIESFVQYKIGNGWRFAGQILLRQPSVHGIVMVPSLEEDIAKRCGQTEGREDAAVVVEVVVVFPSVSFIHTLTHGTDMLKSVR